MADVPPLPVGLSSWERCWRAIELVYERRKRVTAAFEKAGLDYAVIGGLGVGAWVESVDEGAVRGTPNVDVLVRRRDYTAVERALLDTGFVPAEGDVGPRFVDEPEGKIRSGLRVLFAGQKVCGHHLLPAPEVEESCTLQGFRVLDLEPLVRMKLTAFRTIDKVHIQDLMGVGLIDATWPARFPPELAARLQVILDTPDG